jgi:hypothetical protein
LINNNDTFNDESSISGITKGLISFLRNRSFSSLSIFLFNSRNNIIDSEQERGGLDSGFEDLIFDGYWLPDVLFLDVRDFLLVPIDAVHVVALLGVLGSELRDYSNHIHAAVCR